MFFVVSTKLTALLLLTQSGILSVPAGSSASPSSSSFPGRPGRGPSTPQLSLPELTRQGT